MQGRTTEKKTKDKIMKTAKIGTAICLAAGQGIVLEPIIANKLSLAAMKKTCTFDGRKADIDCAVIYLAEIPTVAVAAVPYGFFRSIGLALKFKDESLGVLLKNIREELSTFDIPIDKDTLSKLTREEAEDKAKRIGISLRNYEDSAFFKSREKSVSKKSSASKECSDNEVQLHRKARN